MAERVRDADPVLTAVVVYGHQPSASTQIMTAAGRVCTAIKRLAPEQKVLLAGGHVAALPARTLAEEEADFVAAGEGLHTLVDLVAALKTPAPDLAKVPGLWYRERRPAVRHAGPAAGHRPRRPDAVAAWDLLPMARYRAHNWHCLDGRDRQPYAAVYTTLGCPYHCSLLLHPGAVPRAASRPAACARPPTAIAIGAWTRVLAQIDVLVQRYGVRNIKIADEMFVLNRRHVLGICEGLIRRKYDLNIWAYARVDTIKDGMLDKLLRGRLHLAGARHRGRLRARPGRRGQAVRPAAGL